MPADIEANSGEALACLADSVASPGITSALDPWTSAGGLTADLKSARTFDLQVGDPPPPYQLASRSASSVVSDTSPAAGARFRRAGNVSDGAGPNLDAAHPRLRVGLAISAPHHVLRRIVRPARNSTPERHA